MDPQQTSTKIDVHQIVTDRILAHFSTGIIPWQLPWTTGVPMNLLSKRHYRGINLWLLLALGYEQNLFLTWDQLKSIGGSVNKDETGHVVAFWRPTQKEDGSIQKPMLLYYKVFNVQQCNDMPAELITQTDQSIATDSFEQAESLLNTMHDIPMITLKGKKALFDIEGDEITLPKTKDFRTNEKYYSLLFHFLIHATGTEKRLNRKGMELYTGTAEEMFTKEAFICELGSAYLSGLCGFDPVTTTDTETYITNWIEVFKKDKTFLIRAAGEAQKAIDYLLNPKETEQLDSAMIPIDEIPMDS